jgi:Fic family protein
MPYKENLKRATTLKKELDGFRPLTTEAEQRIMQKFRLDWNYHSSHIEGNSLTYGETKALILFGQTAQAKPLKDHLEMSGHDEAIKTIEEVLKQERPLNENFIRELHEIILKEPYKVATITPDGNPTTKIIKIGQYKSTPNHVKTVTGEIFRFALPEETPAKMHDLMTWYTENINKKDIDPILFATEFHYKFIRIHPFDDGNGRIARLLMNFILMQKGYPPAIIKTEDKRNYFSALQQADSGHLEYFFNYISEQVIHSLEIMIKGAKGESIDEPEDIDKEIELFKFQLAKDDKFTKSKNIETLDYALKESIFPLIISFDEKCFKLKDLFMKIDRNMNISTSQHNRQKEISDPNWGVLIKTLLRDVLTPGDTFLSIEYRLSFKGFKKSLNQNYFISSIKIEFNEFNFSISINSDIQNQKLFIYDNPITKKDSDLIVKALIDNLMNQMRFATGLNK